MKNRGFINILSVIFFNVALIKDGGRITSNIFGLIVDIFVLFIDRNVVDDFYK